MAMLSNGRCFQLCEERDTQAHERTPQIVSFPSTGGVDVSLHTLVPAVQRDAAAAAMGMPLGRGGRKHELNYRC